MAAAVSVAAALAGAALAVPPGPAHAEDLGSLQTEAAQISRSLVQEQLEVDGYQQQYLVAAAELARDATAVARARSRLAGDRQKVTEDRLRLHEQALDEYVAEGASSDGSMLFTTDGATVLSRREYAGVAFANVTLSVDALRTDQQQLRATSTELEERVGNDRVLVARQADLLQRAQVTSQAMQGQQAQVEGRLATAIAQQHAAQVAAVTAAISAASAPRGAAAPIATPIAAPTGAPAGTGSPPGAGATTDPALNPFLQCVVQRESGGNYGAVSPDGRYMGAFQFSQPTWNEAALLAGLPGLVGVPPNLASKPDQDTLAVALYAADGEQPWYDPCRSH